MPKVPQLDWQKLKPETLEVRVKAVSKKMKWHKPKTKKVRLDPRVAYEQHLQREHLRNIKNELYQYHVK